MAAAAILKNRKITRYWYLVPLIKPPWAAVLILVLPVAWLTTWWQLKEMWRSTQDVDLRGMHSSRSLSTLVCRSLWDGNSEGRSYTAGGLLWGLWITSNILQVAPVTIAFAVLLPLIVTIQKRYPKILARTSVITNFTVCTVVQDCCKGRSNKYRKWHFWGSCRPETP